jgi:hypothetical protein
MFKKSTSSLLCLFIIALSFLFNQKVFSQASFSAATNFAITNSSGHIAAGDFNVDGRTDFIVPLFSANQVIMKMNTTTVGASTPTFSANSILAASSGPLAAHSTDLNGDGKADLIVSCYTGNGVSVYINTTTPGSSFPSFTAGAFFVTGVYPYIITSADFNLDGKMDFAVALDAGTLVDVFLNTAAPGSTTPAFSVFSLVIGGTTRFVNTGDFNGDGKPDIVCTAQNDNILVVLMNTTDPGSTTADFTTSPYIFTGTNPQAVKTADVNKDGLTDIVMVNRISELVSVYLNTTTLGSSTPSFTAATNILTGVSPVDLELDDFNNDGKPDIAITNSGNNNISVFINLTSPGASSAVFSEWLNYSTGTTPLYLMTADLNRDGRRDIVTGNSGSANVSVFMNTTTVGISSPSFGNKTNFITTRRPEEIHSGDFNGDGKPDVMTGLVDFFNSDSLMVFLNQTAPGNSTASFTPRKAFYSPQSTGNSLGDINNDGKLDIVSCSNTAINILLNTTSPGSATASFSGAYTIYTSVAVAFSKICIEDLNGDGKPDISFGDFDTEQLKVFFNTTAPGAATPSFSSVTTFPAYDSPTRVCASDFNGDGKPDIALLNSPSGIDFKVFTVYINNTVTGAAAPSFSTGFDFTTNKTSSDMKISDINNDGRPDVLLSGFNGDSVGIYLNSTTIGGSTPSFRPLKTFYVFNEFSGVLSTGDFNSDGLPDIYVSAGRDDSTFTVLLNTTTPGATTASLSSPVQYTGRDRALNMTSADFNLDGKTDMAIGNYDEGSFSVLMNTASLPLPVELAAFSAGVNGNTVMLNWNTVSEENNSGFEIERISFGTGWNKIGFVAGKGTVNTQQNYSFTDNELSSGRYNYRLKQIDYNGNYKYYTLQNEVVIGVPSKFELSQNYPNPFNPTTIINYQLAINSFVNLKIYDVAGREVMQLVNEIKQAGYYTVKFDGSMLSSGMYFYKIQAGDFVSTKKMILVK